MNRLLLLLTLILLPAGMLHAQDDDASGEILHDQWVRLEMQDNKIGWGHMQVVKTNDEIRTSTVMQFEIAMQGRTVPIQIKEMEVESIGGKPKMLRTITQMGPMNIQQQFTFNAEGTGGQLMQNMNGQVRNMQVDALEPEAKIGWSLMKAMAEKLAAGEKSFNLKTITLVEQPEVMSRKIEVTGTETRSILGRDVFGYLMKTQDTVAGMQITGRSFVSPQGYELQSSINMGGMNMKLLTTDETIARSDFEAWDVLDFAIVRVKQPIANPRILRQASYVISSTDEEPLMDMPDTAHQHVERLSPTKLRLTVNLDETNNVEPQAALEHLAQSMMIDPQDEAVIALKDQAVKGIGDDPMKRAEAMRRYVYDKMEVKELSGGMSTSTDVARTLRGDCTEHAVLLAAMLRADGIPARTASGLVYAQSFAGLEDVFGYHMWTQAYINGAWHNLDAAIDANHAFDATHILMRTSALDDGATTNDLIKMIPLMGRIAIEVE